MILRGFKTVFKEHEDVPKHVLLDPFVDILIQNLKEHEIGENLMTTCELDFLTTVVSDHAKLLEEDTVMLILEYFHEVFQRRPYLAHSMKLGKYIGELVNEHKERSTIILRFVEQTIVPQTL